MKKKEILIIFGLAILFSLGSWFKVIKWQSDAGSYLGKGFPLSFYEGGYIPNHEVGEGLMGLN